MNRRSRTPVVGPPTLDWLLAGDPAIRWQTLRDLTDAGADVVAAERSRVAREGWGARLLELQRDDGQWGDGVGHPFWWTNLYTLIWLRDLGVDPTDEGVRRAIDRVRHRLTWGEWHGFAPFFAGESEPCINGRVVALGAYFGEPVEGVVDRLLSEQLDDGGWNCEAERGSTRSSFHTTICVLEGLLAYERAQASSEAVTEARRRGQDYILERFLLRRKSTGELIDADWTTPVFPPLWRYDALRALDHLRSTGNADRRAEDAVTHLRAHRATDGRWALGRRHEDTLYPDLAGRVGAPNRWLTLMGCRVLAWWQS